MANHNTYAMRGNDKYEIAEMLVLSTGHVTESTMLILEGRHAVGESLHWAPTFTRPEGWVWNAYADDATDFPPEFEAIFKLARSLGVAWVMFDCDGPRIEKLPFYKW